MTEHQLTAFLTDFHPVLQGTWINFPFPRDSTGYEVMTHNCPPSAMQYETRFTQCGDCGLLWIDTKLVGYPYCPTCARVIHDCLLQPGHLACDECGNAHISLAEI